MSSMAIEVENLVKVYGEGEARTYALRGVNLTVEKGDYVAIMGPSGSGKSTLLNLMGALDRPTSGKIAISGKDISRLSSAELANVRNREIGFVFQSFNLINRMTALENVELPLLLRNLSPSDRRRRAMLVLKQFGLAEKAKNKPDQLSGGEQQRVAVSRALASDPSIILADEPTGNLDSKNAEQMMEILGNLNQKLGKTLVVITHSEEVARRARRIVHIRDGKIERVEEN
ncbi:MAG: ABC transporter ATP-binding protein [Conexivisphaerales archaeon]